MNNRQPPIANHPVPPCKFTLHVSRFFCPLLATCCLILASPKSPRPAPSEIRNYQLSIINYPFPSLPSDRRYPPSNGFLPPSPPFLLPSRRPSTGILMQKK